MQGHKAAVSWLWHSSTEKQGMQFTLNTAGVHWCLVAEHLYAKSGCSCQELVWHSSTEKQSRMFIGVNAAKSGWAQGCCQLVGTAVQKNKACSLP